MRTALALAARGLGRVWPNPSVGCVLVREDLGDRVVGRGWTAPGGRPHAETVALARAGAAARGAVAYVSLEPCNHHGKTPPCSEALIAAGVKRAVVALEDPDPRTAGAGVARLEAAGISVTRDVCRDEAAALNAGFLTRVAQGRPLFTLKTATTLDGRIATHDGTSRWLTGEAARARGHLLRATHDAIMIGSGTALDDDPLLTCRLPDMAERSPVRIVFDGRLRLPLTSKLVETAPQVPTWLVTGSGGDRDRLRAYRDCGVEVIEIERDGDGSVDPRAAATALGDRGLTRVLVEGGGHLTAALFRVGLIDRLAWFRAPALIGGDGLAIAASLGVDHPDQAPRFRRTAVQPVGVDLLETYERMK